MARGSGGAQATAKRILMHFMHKFAPFDCLISGVYCPSKESFRDISVIHYPGRKKI